MNKEKKPVAKKSSNITSAKGRLDISKNGMGYVIVDGMEKDIIIRPNDLGRAFHGDIVNVQIKNDDGFGKRIEGKITEIVERKQINFVGNIICVVYITKISAKNKINLF